MWNITVELVDVLFYTFFLVNLFFTESLSKFTTYKQIFDSNRLLHDSKMHRLVGTSAFMYSFDFTNIV